MSEILDKTTTEDSSDDDKPPLLRRLFPFAHNGSPSSAIRESLEEVFEESDRQSVTLSVTERTMLANILKFGDLKVKDVMVPRADIVAVEENIPVHELLKKFHDAQHSRLPVYRKTLDDPIGMVSLKNVLEYMEFSEDGTFRFTCDNLNCVRRDILFVPPSMPVVDLMLKMQTLHIHLALVIDEYGGTDGLVSIEDIIEEIVGDIADENEEESPHASALGDGGFLANARISLDDFEDETGIDLHTEDTEDEVETLGGLTVAILGRVPQRGEIVVHPGGYEFEILEADPRRVKRLRIRPASTGPAVSEE